MGEELKISLPPVNVDEILAHHGVLGMRWGRRKSGGGGSGGGRGRIAAKIQGHYDHAEAKQLQKKGVRNLSTVELGKLTKRLQLEKQLKDLNPGKKSAGARVMALLRNTDGSAKTIASLYNTANSPLGLVIQKKIKDSIAKGKVKP